MNSLTELNGYASALSFDFEDNRLPDVIFDRATALAQSIIIDEGFGLTTPVGIEITDIINYQQSAPTYSIDVRNLAGTTVTWPSLPTGVTASEPTPGIYRLSGLRIKAHWDAVKGATVTPPSTYNGTFTFSSSIGFYNQGGGNQTKSWITTVTVNDIQFFTTPLEFTYPVSATATILNTPQIVNVDASYPGTTWTVVATPNSITSVSTFTTTGTGGSFSVNGSTKVITISGTRAQVNARLAGLQITSNANSVDFAITYALSNSLNAVTDSVIQIMSSQGLLYLGAVTTPTIYFTEDATSTSITGVPQITDSAYDGSGQYTYRVTPSTTSAIISISTAETGGSQSFNSSTKVLTITGTKSEINTRITTLTIRTAVDWATDFTLSYTVVTPRADTATKLQVLAIASNDTEITNMNITRSYVSNNANSIFTSSIPSISDFDQTEGNNYTISFSSALGLFGFGADIPVSTLTFTGTRAQCNAKFSAVRFWPTAGVSSNGTFTYIQQKNGVEQVNQNVSLTGSVGSYTPETVVFTSTQNYTPTYSQLRYGTFDLLVVGGGGGGNQGGGGGGGVLQVTGISVTNQTYTITVGAGGARGDGDHGGTYSFWNASGGTGGTSTAFGYSAYGGLGGKSIQSGSSTSAPGGANGLHSLGGTQYNGGSGGSTYPGVDAGGGGAGASGNGSPSVFVRFEGATYIWNGGGGGGGTFSSIGNAVYGGGGGGCGEYGTPGGGGNGGGGGGAGTARIGGDGGANTGGGGGGAGNGWSAATPGLGGSGVVILKIR